MTTISVKGPIISNGEKWVYDFFGESSTCPKDVIDSLPEDGSDITVVINSGGGYVSEGNEIYTALKSYNGTVTVNIVEAASAASVIAMAGDLVKITPVGKIMVHRVSSSAQGNHRAMDKASEMLQCADRAISAAYQIKTGLSEEKLLELMDKETWLNAKEASELGFVDEIMFIDASGTQLVASSTELIPANIISAMQNKKQSGQLELCENFATLESAELVGEELEGMICKAVEKAVDKLLQGKKEDGVKGADGLSRFLFY